MKLRAMMASFFAILMLSSCEDVFEDPTLPDGSKPDIKIASPTANRTFTVEQGIPLKITVVDKDNIKDMTIEVKVSHGKSPLMNFKKNPAIKVLELDTLVFDKKFTPGTYILEVSATDFRSNISTKEISFKIK